jgi:DNA processing protein
MVDPGKYSLAAQILSLKLTGQVGPRTFELLIAYYQTVGSILQAKQRELEELPGIGPTRSQAIGGAADKLDDAQRMIDTLEAGDARVVTRLDEDYPTLLNELNDPPMLLFCRGRLSANGDKRVAVIGSQNVSAEGIGDAVELARRLARADVAVVGGLARGIDTAGHMGALKENGLTCAVLPCGLNHVHPAENAVLAREIVVNGCLLSEYLPDARVTSGRLMARNRLIVGLSQAVVVGEVSPESVGTLDTALCCHQLGKLLFVLIGKHNHHLETLVQRGAIPLTSLDDYTLILKALV